MGGRADWSDNYPRPQLRRQNWQSLCGEWFVGGDETPPGGVCTVPSCLSGEDLFYQKSFDFERTGDVVLLHFCAADQIADVKLNGLDIGIHEGGYLPFEFDISDAVVDGVNLLEVHVQDRLDHMYPYGKQKKKRGGMWYTPMSGLWQSVWVEQLPKDYIRSVRITSDLAGATIEVDCPQAVSVGISGISDAGQAAVTTVSDGASASQSECLQTFRVEPKDPHLWTLDDPYLYTAVITAGSDRAEVYFALRTIDIRSIGGVNRVCLNGQPVFLHGVLDQGYFTPGLMLPPDPAEYSRDILRMKELGFNMLRKHIKTEPEEFYYQCDRLGMLVVQDMVNSGEYSFFRDTVLPTIGAGRSDSIAQRGPREKFFIDHCEKTVAHLYNHPCIIAWTVFNEGWGQFDSDCLYDMFKAWDKIRLVDSTSGWFAQEKSDFDSRHIYFRTPGIKQGGKGGRPLFISECGGYSLESGGHGETGPQNPGQAKRSYGYGKCKDSAQLTGRIEALYDKMVIPAIPLGCCGSVYTQLSDIEDEINGLYSYNRSVCKVEKERIAAIRKKIDSALAQNCGSGDRPGQGE